MRVWFLLGLALIACKSDSLGQPGEDLAVGGSQPDLSTDPTNREPDLLQPKPSPDLLPPAPPKEVIVFVRTGDGLSNNSDGTFALCLNGSFCNNLDNPGINDLERGAVDEFRFDASTLPDKSAISEMRLQVIDGQNAWKPTCMAVLLDGELLYCDDTYSFTLGSGGGGELLSYSAPDPFAKKCASCWGGAITHGPMVGYTTSSTSKIWFRAASGAPVTLELATDSNLTSATMFGPASPSPDTDYMTTIEATGLQPDTRYYYRLLVNGAPATTAPYPSFVTAPSATGKVTIAAGSCAKLADQPIFDTIAGLNPTLMLMMGDNHYANSNDLNVLRSFYRSSREKAGLQKLFARSSVLATWDDHDFVGNNTDGNAPGKDVALRVFKEAWANGSAGTDTTPGVFHHASWGGVDILMIDDRYYRDVDGTMLGAAQHAWLLDKLKSSTASFKLVVSGSQWTKDGSADSWASFDTEREEIFQYIFDNKIGGVVLLSGDIHRSEVRRLVDAAPGKYPIYEFTSSAFAQVPTPCAVSLGSRLGCYANKNSFGYYTIDTTLADPTLRFEIRDVDGGNQYTLDLKRSDLQVP